MSPMALHGIDNIRDLFGHKVCPSYLMLCLIVAELLLRVAQLLCFIRARASRLASDTSPHWPVRPEGAAPPASHCRRAHWGGERGRDLPA